MENGQQNVEKEGWGLIILMLLYDKLIFPFSGTCNLMHVPQVADLIFLYWMTFKSIITYCIQELDYEAVY